jgi:anti-sigma factor RsiW
MVSSVEFAATAVGQRRVASCSHPAAIARQILAAAARFLFLATSSLARAVVPAVVQQAAVDPQQVAYRLLTAAVVRLLLAAAVRLWFLEELISVLAPEEPLASAKE